MAFDPTTPPPTMSSPPPPPLRASTSCVSTRWMARPTSTAWSPSEPSLPSTRRCWPKGPPCRPPPLSRPTHQRPWFRPAGLGGRRALRGGRPATRQEPGGGGLRPLRQRHHDGALHGTRRQLLHAGPGRYLLGLICAVVASVPRDRRLTSFQLLQNAAARLFFTPTLASPHFRVLPKKIR